MSMPILERCSPARWYEADRLSVVEFEAVQIATVQIELAPSYHTAFPG